MTTIPTTGGFPVVGIVVVVMVVVLVVVVVVAKNKKNKSLYMRLYNPLLILLADFRLKG